jgi:hypothetical protein
MAARANQRIERSKRLDGDVLKDEEAWHREQLYRVRRQLRVGEARCMP